MHFLKISVAIGFLLSGARAAIGDACHSAEGSGTCQKTASCGGFYVTGACPNDPTDVKCCIKKSCSTPSAGTCRNTVYACPGSFVPGHCPGPSSVQCCVSGEKGTGPKVIAAAKTQVGVPYSWGGGGCNGKSLGIAQGAHTVGFDCSGLTQYAVCKATNKGTVIPRTTKTQYASHMGKKIPLSQRQPGDFIYYGHKVTGSTCDDVYHVVIWLGNNKVWAAQHTGTLVGEFSYSTANVCPYAVRFW